MARADQWAMIPSPVELPQDLGEVLVERKLLVLVWGEVLVEREVLVEGEVLVERKAGYQPRVGFSC